LVKSIARHWQRHRCCRCAEETTQDFAKGEKYSQISLDVTNSSILGKLSWKCNKIWNKLGILVVMPPSTVCSENPEMAAQSYQL
jgi:hypothetical protein